MHHRIPFLLALRASVRRFKMPLKGLNFVKTLVTIGIIHAAEPLLQNTTKIVCLRCLTFDIFNYINPCRPCSIIWDNFSKSVKFTTRFISETKTVAPNFFCISGTSNSLSASSKNLKNSIGWKIFARTSLTGLTSLHLSSLNRIVQGKLLCKKLLCYWGISL